MQIIMCDDCKQTPFTHFCIYQKCFCDRRVCSNCRQKHKHQTLDKDQALQYYFHSYAQQDKQDIKQILKKTLEMVQQRKKKLLLQVNEFIKKIDKIFEEVASPLICLQCSTDKEYYQKKKTIIHDQKTSKEELKQIANQIRLLKDQKINNKKSIEQLCQYISQQFKHGNDQHEVKSTVSEIQKYIKSFSLFQILENQKNIQKIQLEVNQSSKSSIKRTNIDQKKKRQFLKKGQEEALVKQKKTIEMTGQLYYSVKWFNKLLEPTFVTIECLSLREEKLNQIPKQLSLFPNLKILSLRSNQITKIENLENLTNLVTLNLYQNQISKLENLNALTKLQKLLLFSNKIEKIQNLDGLICLQVLYLRKNKITNIENLQCLISLKQLCLYDNPLRKTPTAQRIINDMKKKQINCGIKWSQ